MGEAISPSDRARHMPHHLSCTDLGRAQNAGPMESVPLGLPECLNLSSLDVGGACSPGQASDDSWQSNLEPELCGQGGHMRRERGQAQCG